MGRYTGRSSFTPISASVTRCREKWFLLWAMGNRVWKEGDGWELERVGGGDFLFTPADVYGLLYVHPVSKH